MQKALAYKVSLSQVNVVMRSAHSSWLSKVLSESKFMINTGRLFQRGGVCISGKPLCQLFLDPCNRQEI